MPANKKTSEKKKNPPASKQGAKNTKNTSAKPKSAQTKTQPAPEQKPKRDPDSLLHQFIPCVLVVAAIVMCVFLAVKTNESAGVVGGFIRMCSYGLFGWGAWLIPVLLVACALVWKKTIADGSIGSLFGFSSATLVVISALMHAIAEDPAGLGVFNPAELFTEGAVGGAVGGFIANLLIGSIQKTATYILLAFIAVILVMFTLRLTPRAIILYIKYKRALARERARERNAELEDEYERRIREQERRPEDAPAAPEKKGRKKNIILSDEDMPEGKAEESEDGQIPISMFADPHVTARDLQDDSPKDPIVEDKAELAPIDELDLRQVLIPPERADVLPEVTVEDEDVAAGIPPRRVHMEGDDGVPPFDIDTETGEVTLEGEALETSRETLGEDAPAPKPEKKKIYRFPPISILAKAAPVNESGVQEELAQNARKLVDTLMSFRVKTKILSVSRGPTITRYELSPEAGTRVRSIANLVDDIALNLATSGVRIEAPIPGKSAVGIEVPNKTVSTVRLRELIEADAFKNAESKLNVALGVDVAGTPVYCNLAKMPHMLIAGATGMGKSVCINSIISSILYKANPDEVKLMLVDPKKVEFNIYNGLPHLLVPVVSDPQKAAGSLNWAVGEMERRFTLIDEVGVRDITGYNEITKNDPDREPMPYVVIIIDELADLMMTAPDAVETSICRLAQKARAAGMHLVIGTQRPSVDVITGLIKANIPSRIAFTVASQVDSKTIIDIGGAEKLIGRGDMLYAPVGFMKPLRVQGAFVSDEEVRSVTDFIRSEGGFIEYDPEIISSIEREAERCAQKGKGSSGGDFDEDELRENVDPKFREAIEVAVNSGKISTSLLQRHLSIGYGRAAKIIDRMQALGYVSPPDGQKPRDVLITKQMYMEMVVNGENF